MYHVVVAAAAAVVDEEERWKEGLVIFGVGISGLWDLAVWGV